MAIPSRNPQSTAFRPDTHPEHNPELKVHRQTPNPSLPLFDPKTHARTSDPETSKEAAVQAEQFANTHAWKIWLALKNRGPMGKTRIAAATGLHHVEVARRLSDLQIRGQAEPTGTTEKSASGRKERVWRSC